MSFRIRCVSGFGNRNGGGSMWICRLGDTHSCCSPGRRADSPRRRDLCPRNKTRSCRQSKDPAACRRPRHRRWTGRTRTCGHESGTTAVSLQRQGRLGNKISWEVAGWGSNICRVKWFEAKYFGKASPSRCSRHSIRFHCAATRRPGWACRAPAGHWDSPEHRLFWALTNISGHRGPLAAARCPWSAWAVAAWQVGETKGVVPRGLSLSMGVVALSLAGLWLIFSRHWLATSCSPATSSQRISLLLSFGAFWRSSRMRGFDARKEKRNLHFTFVPLELSFFTHAHTVVEERANGKATARRENRLRTKPSFCGRQAQSRAARSEKQPKTRRYAAFGHFTCRATLSDRIESEQRRAAAQRCCQRAGNMLPSHRFARLQLGCLRFFFLVFVVVGLYFWPRFLLT